MEKIDIKNLDKSNWELYRFDQICKNVSERVDPNNTEIKVYIGLEHLDSESIHIKRFGTPDEVKGQKLKGYPGDIIFGKRRAYQRKAALISEESVCSAHAFILRANPEVIDPQFFPFFLHSDMFMHRAVDISVGGLSPTINWGILKSQEFLLPPKDQQAQLAELFWAMDEVIEKEKILLNKSIQFEEVNAKSIFLVDKSQKAKVTKVGKIRSEWKCISLQNMLDEGLVLSHLDGNHGSSYPRNEEFVESGVPYISANCICGDEISFENAKYLTEERANTIKKGVARNGDILLAHNATVGPVCFLNTKYEKVILSTTLTYYRLNPDEVNGEYLFYFMKSRLFQTQLERVMNQSTRNQVPITTQRKLYFVIPPLHEQIEVIKKLKIVAKNSKEIAGLVDCAQSLQKSLINQVF